MNAIDLAKRFLRATDLDLDLTAEAIAAEIEAFAAERTAGYERDLQAYHSQTGLVPEARFIEAVELGQKQANEFDRYWKAAGVLDAKVTVDDAIARYQALVARAKAAEALVAELRRVLHGMKACADLWLLADPVLPEHEGEARALHGAYNDITAALAKTPTDMGAELTRLQEGLSRYHDRDELKQEVGNLRAMVAEKDKTLAYISRVAHSYWPDSHSTTSSMHRSWVIEEADKAIAKTPADVGMGIEEWRDRALAWGIVWEALCKHDDVYQATLNEQTMTGQQHAVAMVEHMGAELARLREIQNELIAAYAKPCLPSQVVRFVCDELVSLRAKVADFETSTVFERKLRREAESSISAIVAAGDGTWKAVNDLTDGITPAELSPWKAAWDAAKQGAPVHPYTMSGLVLRMGTMNVSGEEVTGYFIEAPREQLAALKESPLYRHVSVVVTEPAMSPANEGSGKLPTMDEILNAAHPLGTMEEYLKRIAGTPAEALLARARDPKQGDIFTHKTYSLTITSHADGVVNYNICDGTAVGPGCTTIEEWHKIVANTLKHGAAFIPVESAIVTTPGDDAIMTGGES